jgi:hypothetical protein
MPLFVWLEKEEGTINIYLETMSIAPLYHFHRE